MIVTSLPSFSGHGSSSFVDELYLETILTQLFPILVRSLSQPSKGLGFDLVTPTRYRKGLFISPARVLILTELEDM